MWHRGPSRLKIAFVSSVQALVFSPDFRCCSTS
ncbi:hypothetical protein M3J09_012269 [Ascochyta lentis]